jgi:hypothetical protein
MQNRDMIASSSFLRGWDAAMKIRFPELLAENTELHSRLYDIEAAKLSEPN